AVTTSPAASPGRAEAPGPAGTTNPAASPGPPGMGELNVVARRLVRLDKRPPPGLAGLTKPAAPRQPAVPAATTPPPATPDQPDRAAIPQPEPRGRAQLPPPPLLSAGNGEAWPVAGRASWGRHPGRDRRLQISGATPWPAPAPRVPPTWPIN